MSLRTEPPTPRRLAEAHRKGEFPRSKLMSLTGALVGGTAGLALALPTAVTRLRQFATAALSLAHPAGGPLVWAALRELAVLCIPVGAGAVLGALSAGFAVGGFHLVPGLLTPKWERMSLAKGVERFAPGPSLRSWGGALLTGCLLLAVAVGVLRHGLSSGAMGPSRSSDIVLSTGVLGHVGRLAPRALVLLLGLGILDAIRARHRHRTALLMTRDEVRRDWRESEGDPLIKSRRRAAHRELLAVGVRRGVAAASMVVVNPTHLAVALRYAPREAEAPYLVAKGHDRGAAILREQARRHGVPVVRDVPLARQLYSLTVGEPIPEELYVAAAAVLKVAWDEAAREAQP